MTLLSSTLERRYPDNKPGAATHTTVINVTLTQHNTDHQNQLSKHIHADMTVVTVHAVKIRGKRAVGEEEGGDCGGWAKAGEDQGR